MKILMVVEIPDSRYCSEYHGDKQVCKFLCLDNGQYQCNLLLGCLEIGAAGIKKASNCRSTPQHNDGYPEIILAF